MEALKKIMCVTWLIVLAVGFLAVIAVAGCTEEQLNQADQAAGAVEIAAQTADTLLDSPAASLIPFSNYARIGVEAILLLLAAWKANQSRIRGLVLRSVVRAVEQQPAQSQASVKMEVANNLKAAGIETTGKTVIASAKAA